MVEEACHDAEVAAASPQRPQKVGVLAFACGHEAAVGQDHVGLDEIVDRESILPGEVAVAAGERVWPANAAV